MTDVQTPQPTHVSRGKKITVATLVTLGLATGGVVAAEASFASGGSGSSSSTAPAKADAPKPPAAPSANDLDGTVTAVSSDSITVKNQFGTSRTFAITSSTAVHQGPTKSAASALEVGQRVHVGASKSGSTYTAKDIDVRLAHIDGAVASLSGDSITVTDNDGFTRTVSVSSTTKYTKDGKSADRSDLTGSSVIHARGTVADDGTTLDATTVDIVTKDAAPKGPGAGPAGGPAGVPAPGKVGKGGKGGPPAPPTGGKAPSGAPKAPSGAPKAPSGAPKAPSGAPKAPSGAPKAPSGAPSAPAAPSGGASSGS